MVVIDGFPMDVALVEEPTFSATLTQFPMEDGVDINDHLHHDPDMLQIECIVSDTPFNAVKVARAADPNAVSTGDDVLASDQAYVRLKQIKEAGEPVDVDTSIDFFTNMVMLTMTPSRMGDAVKYTCTFQRASFVTNERTQIRVAVPRAQAPKNLGPKSGVQFDPKDPIIWCKKRRDDGSCALSELVGIDPKTQVWYHADGKTPLSEEDMEDMRRDSKEAYELDLAKRNPAEEITDINGDDYSSIDRWKGRDYVKDGVVFDKDGFANASSQSGFNIPGPPYTGNLE